MAGNQPMLPQDKQLVGALDSACNRTCAGQIWVNNYLDALRQHAPPFVQSLILCEGESENFRFGNNGVVPSIQRWRLPAMVGETAGFDLGFISAHRNPWMFDWSGLSWKQLGR